MRNHWIEVGDITYICVWHRGFLTKGIIDTKYLDIIRKYPTWSYANGYLRAERKIFQGKKQKIHLSRVIIEQKQIIPYNCVIDHINHKREDNREENLRILTISGNATNSIRTGVLLHHGGWQVRLEQKGIRYNLGTYQTKEFALQVSKDAKEKLIQKEIDSIN